MDFNKLLCRKIIDVITIILIFLQDIEEKRNKVNLEHKIWFVQFRYSRTLYISRAEYYNIVMRNRKRLSKGKDA